MTPVSRVRRIVTGVSVLTAYHCGMRAACEAEAWQVAQFFWNIEAAYGSSAASAVNVARGNKADTRQSFMVFHSWASHVQRCRRWQAVYHLLLPVEHCWLWAVWAIN